MHLKINVHVWRFVQLLGVIGVAGSKVLLVSMDGFRWDYINQVDTPNFDDFAAKGTRADYINNTFVTKTFPCHYTIATGLYEESHGIISNHMYDPLFNETFDLSSEDTKWWDGGEPLWVTTRKRGLHSAVFFWPGSYSKIRGLRPNIYKPYDESVPFKTRVDTVVQWLSNTSFNIDLAMLYFHEPDRAGHAFGPNSSQVRSKVRYMDSILGYIVQKFNKAHLWDSVNVLVTSDHGMTEIDVSTRHIDLSTLINMDAVDIIPVVGPTSNILPKANMEDDIMLNLTGVAKLTVYRKADIPDHWHYKHNRRILPILAVADEGWLIVKSPADYNLPGKGTHGYDNALMSMKPIFYARGPNIKVGHKTPSFNSVDIYPLVCELLGITPSPNNGTLENTKNFLMSSPVYGMLLLTALLFMFGTIQAHDRGVARRTRPMQMGHPIHGMQASEWRRLFNPELPNEDEIDCHFDIEVTETIGGRCVRLAGTRRLAVCQSGMYLDVNSQQCHHLLTAQQSEQHITPREDGS